MTWKDIVKQFQTIADANQAVAKVGFGKEYETFTPGTNEYPFVYIDYNTLIESFNAGATGTISFTVSDRVRQDNDSTADNELNAYTRCIQIGQSIIYKVEGFYEGLNQSPLVGDLSYSIQTQANYGEDNAYSAIFQVNLEFLNRFNSCDTPYPDSIDPYLPGSGVVPNPDCPDACTELIDSNSEAIQLNNELISDNTLRIQNNTSAISDNNDAIADNETNIVSLKKDIQNGEFEILEDGSRETYLRLSANYAGSIDQVYAKTSAGTVDLIVQINGTQATNTLSVSTSKQSASGDASNTFAIGDEITLNTSNASGVENLSWQINYSIL